MWLLHLLPDSFLNFIVNAVLLAGIVGVTLFFFVINRFLRFIPALAPYYRIGQAVSAVLLVAGVYFKGGYSTEMMWRERVHELEAKMQEVKVESAKVNTVIEEKIVYRDKIIRQQGETLIQKIDNIITVEKDCAVPQEAIDVHNEAARMNRIIEQQRKATK